MSPLHQQALQQAQAQPKSAARKAGLLAALVSAAVFGNTAFAQQAATAAPASPPGHNELKAASKKAASDAAADLAAGKADEPMILKAPAPDRYRVYINDPAHFAAITQQFIIDGQKGRVIGMTDGGFLPNPVVADDGSMFAQASTVFERIARGKRTDYVEVFDPLTLLPTADIVLPETPRFLIGTYSWLTALTPDNSKLLFQRFAPTPAVGVVDLAGKKMDRTLNVPDCFHIFPNSPTTFYMHCRDGTMAHVNFGAAGEAKVTQSRAFHAENEFLINHPAYSTKAKRLIWPTYTGRIHQLDLSGAEPKFLNTIEGLTEAERGQEWAPGGWQQVAYHRASDRIFLLVDQRDKWRHKTASRFVLVIDAKDGKRLSKFDLKNEIDSIGVSQGEGPLLYALSAGTQTLHIHDAQSGKELRQVNQLGRGPQVITTADMGS